MLQLTFPELENTFSHASGENYWKLVKSYPHCQNIRDLEANEIINEIEKFKGFGSKRTQKTAAKLKKLADTTYPVVSQNSPETSDVVYYADRLLQLDQDRNERLTQMIEIAQNLDNHDLEISWFR